LSTPLETIRPTERDGSEASNLTPGSRYPLQNVRGKTFSVLRRDDRLIARKVGRDVQFVVPASKIQDEEKRRRLELVHHHLAALVRNGTPISKVTVTPDAHVVYLIDGDAYFAGYAPEGGEGFLFES
jgi:hypothetical protein